MAIRYSEYNGTIFLHRRDPDASPDGGSAPMAPQRRQDIAALGLKAVPGGSPATLMTATLAGILLG